MTPADRACCIQPWLRPEHAPAYAAALDWLLPRCRTEEERALAPVLLLLLAPFNALVAPCRPVAGSPVNFQVTLSRGGTAGPERVRLTVRAGPAAAIHSGMAPPGQGSGVPDLWLESTTLLLDPMGSAARVLGMLIVLLGGVGQLGENERVFHRLEE